MLWFKYVSSAFCHCVYKTVIKSYFLHNGIFYTGIMISICWNDALNIWFRCKQYMFIVTIITVNCLSFMLTLWHDLKNNLIAVWQHQSRTLWYIACWPLTLKELVSFGHVIRCGERCSCGCPVAMPPSQQHPQYWIDTHCSIAASWKWLFLANIH